MLTGINPAAVIYLVLIISFPISAQKIRIEGQAISWLTTNPQESFESNFGIRYLPEIYLDKSIGSNFNLDAEISVNSYLSTYFNSKNDFSSNVKLYRTWLRFTTVQWEVRAGLQKINFGSASMLRPLMWFDKIDPRDPLQLTAGVYGILGRYYFLNNANIWLWTLYGNNGTKGWEQFKTSKKYPELGGRFQHPIFSGEIAATFHHRKFDFSNENNISENRFALDGRWDYEIGFWFETALINNNLTGSVIRFQKMLNLGVDYTFGIGNGLYISTEHLITAFGDKIFRLDEKNDFSAISIRYPFGIIDNFFSIFYYNYSNNDIYRFFNWQRTYDDWIFHLIAFWNPNQMSVFQSASEGNLFSGKGIQLMVVFNH